MAATAIRTATAIRMVFFPPEARSPEVSPSEANAGASTWVFSASSCVFIFAGAVAAACPDDMPLLWERITGALEAPGDEGTSFPGTGGSACDLPVASAARRSALAIGSAAGLEIGCHGYSFGGADGVVGCGIDFSRAASGASGAGTASASPWKSEALTAGMGDGGGCAGKCTGGGFGAGICGADGFFAGIWVAADCGGAVGAGLAGFAASVFRSRPRATRSVPFDCSTLIGL